MSSNVTVVVDVHEPEGIADAFREIDEVESVLIAPLEAADIAIGGVGFERKTWNDYASSMQDNRLDEQAAKMGEFDHAYILIDGDMFEAGTQRHTAMTKASLLGHAASLTVREEYPVEAVIPCSNRRVLADYAVRLARKHEEDLSSPYLPTGDVGVDEPPGKQMWGCCPGVGPELADRLWTEFGPPSMFVDLTRQSPGEHIEALRDVEGIGAERAERIMEVLRNVG